MGSATDDRSGQRVLTRGRRRRRTATETAAAPVGVESDPSLSPVRQEIARLERLTREQLAAELDAGGVFAVWVIPDRVDVPS